MHVCVGPFLVNYKKAGCLNSDVHLQISKARCLVFLEGPDRNSEFNARSTQICIVF